MAQAPTDEDNKEENDTQECRLFFVYGTLRDDLQLINPKETSTIYGSQWFHDEYEACYAQLRGYKMYRHKSLPYPFIVETKDNNDIILGRLVRFVFDDDNINDENKFKNKLAYADRVERYNPKNTEAKLNLYQRGKKLVQIVEYPYKTKEKKQIKDRYPKDSQMFKKGTQHVAYFYYQTKDCKTLLNNDEYDLVDTGDWIMRPGQAKNGCIIC